MKIVHDVYIQAGLLPSTHPYSHKMLVSKASRVMHAFHRRSFEIAVVVLVLSFAASVALHFISPASIGQFAVAILAILSGSCITRAATRGIVLTLQSGDNELLAGIFNGIFG